MEKAETKKETKDKSGKPGQWEPHRQRGWHRLWYYSSNAPVV